MLPVSVPVAGEGLSTIGTPLLWAVTIGAIIALFVFDFIITHKDHEVSMKEATGWSVFYIALPLLFGVYVLTAYGTRIGIEFYTGYIVEKSLSVDNLFVFILLLSSFAVPRALQQRVLLFGILGALILRGVFIAIGAVAISRFDAAFLVFGAILLVTAVKVLLDALKGEEKEVHVSELKVVRLLSRIAPVADDYNGHHFTVKEGGKRLLTPFALVVAVILVTDVVFAVDSVPAVYGITGDPYLVFITNAFALLGLRALYFLLEGALSKLVHLSYGLAFILFFIGAKLVLHWAHVRWEQVPEISTPVSLGVILLALVTVTVTSLIASSRRPKDETGTPQPSRLDEERLAP